MGLPPRLLVFAVAMVLTAAQRQAPRLCTEVEATGFAAGDPIRLGGMPSQPLAGEVRDILRREPLRCLLVVGSVPGQCTGVTWLAGNRAVVEDRGETGGTAFARIILQLRFEAGLGLVQLYVREADAKCITQSSPSWP